MRLVGHGIDIVGLDSMQRLLGHSENEFLEQCFTPAERQQLPAGRHRLVYVARNFAAKEAVLKAIGTGFGSDVAFADVEIGHSVRGPTVRLDGGAARTAAALAIDRWLIGISHSEAFAIASAIAIASD